MPEAEEYCGECAGHAEVTCPKCFGFPGRVNCKECDGTGSVACPQCASGDAPAVRY